MNKALFVVGNNRLKGTLKVNGSKNASLAIITSSILCKRKIILKNVPKITDIDVLIEILKYLECKVNYRNNKLTIDAKNIKYKSLCVDLVSKYRASYYFMGAFLSLFSRVIINKPGGCKIGLRPIDIHTQAFIDLGYTINEDDSCISISKNEEADANITFRFPSVGATNNILIARAFSNYQTIINNVALEPEIDDLINFLNKTGAHIIRQENKIIILPYKKIKTIKYKIMSDRIEAGTYLIYAAALADKVQIKGINKSHLKVVIEELKHIGINMKEYKKKIIVYKSSIITGTDIITGVYPFFPTDLQQIMTVLLLQSISKSTIVDEIYQDRIAYIKQLKKMNANIYLKNKKINIDPVNIPLKGANLVCEDLRGAAALLLAALCCQEKCSLFNVGYLFRGYSNIINSLNKIGANIYEKTDI